MRELHFCCVGNFPEVLISQMRTVHKRAQVLEGQGTGAADANIAYTAAAAYESSMSRSMASRSCASGYSGPGNSGGYNPVASEISMVKLRKTDLAHRDGKSDSDGDNDTSSPVTSVVTLSPHTMRELVDKFDQPACNSVEGSVISRSSFGAGDEGGVAPSVESAGEDEDVGTSAAEKVGENEGDSSYATENFGEASVVQGSGSVDSDGEGSEQIDDTTRVWAPSSSSNLE